MEEFLFESTGIYRYVIVLIIHVSIAFHLAGHHVIVRETTTGYFRHRDRDRDLGTERNITRHNKHK